MQDTTFTQKHILITYKIKYFTEVIFIIIIDDY
jgi:hypothetical protein